MVPSHLIELGQQALADVTTNVAKGEPLVRCQLLASEFYEALKRELLPTSELGVAERAMVLAATNQCQHAAGSPSCLISCSQSPPEGGCSVDVGRHGAMIGRARGRPLEPKAAPGIDSPWGLSGIM